MRWWSCPFAAIEAVVPPQGRILEVGSGHGLLSLFLALSQPGRQVHGVDVDEAKVDVARLAAERMGAGDAGPSFATVAPGWLPDAQGADEHVDAIVIADVLYLLEPEDQRRLLVACARGLGPGGLLVIKEVSTEPGWKFRWNTLQETLSTRVLRITAGGGGLHFVAPATMAGWLGDERLVVESRSIDRRYPWPHHLLVARC